MIKNNKLENLINLLFEVGTLRKIPRSHTQVLFTNDQSDNISSHSFRVSVIGWSLAKLEKADPYKVLLMSLFHDFSETRSGDANAIHKRYIKTFEKEISKDQLANSPDEKELTSIIEEYEGRESLEAKIVKDADLLDQILLLKEYSLQGNEEAKSWLKSKRHEKGMFTKTAKLLAKKIYVTSPHDWWVKNATFGRRK